MRLFRRLLPIAKRYRAHALGAVLCIGLATLLDVIAMPLLVAGMFATISERPAAISAPAAAAEHPSGLAARVSALRDRAQQWGEAVRQRAVRAPVRWLFIFAGLLLGAYLFKALAGFGQLYLAQHLAQHLMGDLRQMLFDKLLHLPPAFYDARQTGDLMSRTMSDVRVLQDLVSIELAQLVVAGFTIVLGLVFMVTYNWQLTLLALALVPLISWVVSRAGNRMRLITRTIQRRLAGLNVRLQERLLSIRIVQSFTREDDESEAFREINQQAVRSNLQGARIAAALSPLIEFIGITAMTIGIVFAGWQVVRHHLSAAGLLAIFLVAQKVGSQFSRIGRINLTVQQALAGGQRVFEILDSEAEVTDAPDARPLPPVQGRIDFRDVFFCYAGGEHVLQDVNLRVEPGEIVALVGASGAGKTSLVSLIPRFYDPTRGAIEVDGRDIRRVTLRSLRGQIGIVPQETILFGGTVYDNILYGRPDASRDEVIEAARAAHADEFIRALPDGYDTEVGERALKLSGGQRQRLAIARAVLKDPRILILDEATSSLDSTSERLVQDALDRLMKGRTTLVIAHRLSTVRNAHRILVLSDGRIVEQGNHHELMARDGIYRRLYEMQFRLEDLPHSAPSGEAADGA